MVPAASASARPAGDYVHLFMIYVVWASGYLAMKLGIAGPDALTAFQMQGGRLVLGGVLLLAIAWWGGRAGGFGARELALCAAAAFLFWICGNGFALLALRDLPSGYVAMAMGTIPIWSAALEAVRRRRPPAQPLALAIGFAGLALIYCPAALESGSLAAPPRALAYLFFAPIAWNLATALQPAIARSVDPAAAAGVQLVLGGLMAGVLAFAEGAPLPDPPGAQSLAAALYLAVFASALSFNSYVRATALFPAPVVSAFAYVNPVVGVLLGWLVLTEEPAPVSLLGMTLVIVGVALTLARSREDDAPGLSRAFFRRSGR